MQANEDPTIDDLLGAVFRVVQQIKQTVHADPVERAAIIILSRLKHCGPVRLSDLAGDLMLDISTVSRQAKALEDRGLVTRADDPADRRAVRIDLAPAGREVLAGAWARRHDWLATSLADWSTEDRRALAAMLARFADALGAPESTPAPRSPPGSTPPTLPTPLTSAPPNLETHA